MHDVGMRKTEPRADNPYLRNTSAIEVGQVFTIEPGLYFIDGLLEGARQGPHRDALDWALVDRLRPFGGIRIEDNALVTADGPRNLTREAFARVDELTGIGEEPLPDRAGYEVAVLRSERDAAEATTSALAEGVAPRALLVASAHAAAVRVARFDPRWQHRLDAEVSVLDVTHTLTFADAALDILYDEAGRAIGIECVRCGSKVACECGEPTPEHPGEHKGTAIEVDLDQHFADPEYKRRLREAADRAAANRCTNFSSADSRLGSPPPPGSEPADSALSTEAWLSPRLLPSTDPPSSDTDPAAEAW